LEQIWGQTGTHGNTHYVLEEVRGDRRRRELNFDHIRSTDAQAAQAATAQRSEFFRARLSGPRQMGNGLLLPGLKEQKMPLLNLVIVLIVVGVALYLVNRYIPMASSIKTILNVVVVVAVCVWVLQATGLWGSVTTFRLSK
jgi:hypothetical protein